MAGPGHGRPLAWPRQLEHSSAEYRYSEFFEHEHIGEFVARLSACATASVVWPISRIRRASRNFPHAGGLSAVVRQRNLVSQK